MPQIPDRHWNLRAQLRALRVVLCLLVFFACMDGAFARNLEDDLRRQQVGLNFFPNIIAVDEDILSKLSDSGNLTLLFVYSSDPDNARKLAAQLGDKVKSIKKSPVKIVVTDTPEPSEKPGGIFLAEWLPDSKFRQVIDFGITQGIIVFSPFVGDVERGATAGLNISTKIRPALNLTTLEKSKIRINPMFRRLSKHYE